MLRLTAVVLMMASWAHGAPPTESKTLDLSVSPEEHALRDLVPGWVPCRALTEDEMVPHDSPHRMRMSGYPKSAPPRLIIPVVPTAWTADWPEPAPLAATGVPRGWWWMPEDPKWRGAWIVLGQGKPGRGNHFFTMVTTPLRAADYGSFGRAKVVQGIYNGLRDRVAARKGVTPADLDRVSGQLAKGPGHPSPIDAARARARQLDREDRIEEAARLLDAALDDGSGTDRQRAKALLELHRYRMLIGDLEGALQALEACRPHAEEAGLDTFISIIDEQVPNYRQGIADATPATRLTMRALASFERGRLDHAIVTARSGLQVVAEDEPFIEFDLRRTLARALVANGDSVAARKEVDLAAALARKLDDPDAEREVRALLPMADD